MVANAQVPETRQVVCTHCDRPIEIPASAMSVSCRHCHRRVIIEDIVIKAYHAVVRLATAGRVEVAGRAHLIAEIRVNELVVEGAVKGNVVALDRVAIGRKGTLLGNVSSKSLAVEPGATLVGRVRVSPEFELEPRIAPEESEVADL